MNPTWLLMCPLFDPFLFWRLAFEEMTNAQLR